MHDKFAEIINFTLILLILSHLKNMRFICEKYGIWKGKQRRSLMKQVQLMCNRCERLFLTIPAFILSVTMSKKKGTNNCRCSQRGWGILVSTLFFFFFFLRYIFRSYLISHTRPHNISSILSTILQVRMLYLRVEDRLWEIKFRIKIPK